MYIRQISQARKDGTRVRYLQLAHKVRDPRTGRPTDKVLYHFGREDQLDKEQLKRLALSLSRFLTPSDQAEVQGRLFGAEEELEVEKTLVFGGSFVLDALWRRMEMDGLLGKLLAERAFDADVERVLFALVANRALSPRSKLGVERWVGRKVHIEGLSEVHSHTLYRAMDFLLEHEEALQKAVFGSVATLFNLEVDLIFFDTTSTYFELDEADGEGGLRRYGYSRDKRGDLPQVSIGLAVTRDGIPVRCWVWPGNTADASTVEQVQKDLAGWRLSRVVWVVDRGFAGHEQEVAFQRGGGQVIVGEKLRSSTGKLHPALSRPGRFKVIREDLEIKEVVLVDGGSKRRTIVVRNPKEAEHDLKVRENILSALGAEIERLNSGKGPRGAGHSKAVCALKSHSAFGRYVKELKGGRLVIDTAKVKADEMLDGKYVIFTTDPTLSAEDVVLGYKQLAEVEACFRTLKTTLELRPIYHRLEDRIRAHVLLCWLALLLVRVAETTAGETWRAMREELDEITVTRLATKDGRSEIVSLLTDAQRNILKKLTIKPPVAVRKVNPTAEKA
ncbi:MAG: IS1634 family transposase [Candidatus Thermoplasmatota archaeon]